MASKYFFAHQSFQAIDSWFLLAARFSHAEAINGLARKKKRRKKKGRTHTKKDLVPLTAKFFDRLSIRCKGPQQAHSLTGIRLFKHQKKLIFVHRCCLQVLTHRNWHFWQHEKTPWAPMKAPFVPSTIDLDLLQASKGFSPSHLA